jgi:hypothetical protein
MVIPPAVILIILAGLLYVQKLRCMEVRRVCCAAGSAGLVVAAQGWGARHVAPDQEGVDGSYVYIHPSLVRNIEKEGG